MNEGVFDVNVVKEEPAFTLHGVFTIAHCDDEYVKVYWNDLYNAEQGDEWEASGNSQVMIATVLYKDEEGCLVRIVTEDHNDYTNYDDVVVVQYYDFGRG